MKKIVLMLVLALSLTNCKKEDNSPQKSAATVHDTVYVTPPPPPADPHFTYYWDYKNPGDPQTYSDSGCLTVAEMNAKIVAIGAFNVMKSVTCIP